MDRKTKTAFERAVATYDVQATLVQHTAQRKADERAGFIAGFEQARKIASTRRGKRNAKGKRMDVPDYRDREADRYQPVDLSEEYDQGAVVANASAYPV
jgi:hypothetical protein